MTRVSTNLGKVATTPKGEYNSAVTYLKLDVVLYNGSSYVCLKQSIGNLPTNTEYWQLLASKGETGQPGYTPVKGVDYFTAQDIASLNIPSKTSDLTNDSGYITNTVDNLTNYYKKNETYTQSEIDNKLTAVYKYKGTVATYNNLPSTGLTIGDVYNVEDTGDNYAWEGLVWDKLGATIDLSNYVQKTDYATSSSGGVIKTGQYSVNISNGFLTATNRTYAEYDTMGVNHFISKGTLDNVIEGKELQTQYSTMPVASADLLGKIVQYVGITNANYINGYFYKCVSDGQATPTYSWEKENTVTMNVTYTDNTTATFELKGREIV